MYIIEVIPLISLKNSRQRVLSFYHTENLPAGSLVEVPSRSKKIKAIVINSQSIKYLKVRIKKEANFELEPISRVLDENPHPGKDPLDVTLWFPPKKVPETKSASETIQAKEMLAGYLEKLAKKKALLSKSDSNQTSRARNYMQETAERYLKYINWQNETFAEDMRLFWVSASNYYRSHTHHDFVKILEWIEEKDSLTPRQVAKLFNKA